MTCFSLDLAGATKEGRAFDVRTRGGAFAGLVSERYGRGVRVWFNGSATRGSAKLFADIPAALEYIAQRRIKKGWGL